MKGFAEVIGMNPNSITNHARRKVVPQNLALLAVLIAEMSANGVDYKGAIAKVKPKKRPRGLKQQGKFGGDPQASLELEE